MDLASKFDRLPTAGFDDVLKVGVGRVDSEITAATGMTYEPEKQRIAIIRWNAMREVMDAMTGYITQTQTQRDQILKDKGEEDA